MSYGCMSNTQNTDNLQSVFSLFDSNVHMATVLGVGPSAVSEMKRRNSIPVEYWPAIVSFAPSRGSDLSFERLVFMTNDAREKAKERA